MNNNVGWEIADKIADVTEAINAQNKLIAANNKLLKQTMKAQNKLIATNNKLLKQAIDQEQKRRQV